MKFVNFNKLTSGVEYVPEFDYNREAAEEDKMVFTIKPMTNLLQRKYDAMLRIRMVGKKKDEMKSNSQEVQAAVWRDCVLSFTNITIEDPQTTDEKVPTSAEAYEILPQELIKEIIEAIESKSTLEEGVKKP